MVRSHNPTFLPPATTKTQGWGGKVSWSHLGGGQCKRIINLQHIGASHTHQKEKPTSQIREKGSGRWVTLASAKNPGWGGGSRHKQICVLGISLGQILGETFRDHCSHWVEIIIGRSNASNSLFQI